MKYRKLPVIIDAECWDGESFDEFGVLRFTNDPIVESSLHGCGQLWGRHGYIETLEGRMVACPGDFIITGVHGERYPCKPDIFAKTYEKVEEMTTFSDVEGVVDRFRYHAPTAVTVVKHEAIREAYIDLARLLMETIPPGRHASLALTDLQNSMMWANAAIAVDTPREA